MGSTRSHFVDVIMRFENVKSSHTPTINQDGAEPIPLSAITIQSLADLGYDVNAGLADEYRLPAPASAKPAAGHLLDWGDCIADGPVYVVDENGRIIGMIGE